MNRAAKVGAGRGVFRRIAAPARADSDGMLLRPPPASRPPLSSRPPRGARPHADTGAIEWEELPSLADTLAERLVVLGSRHRDALAAAKARAAAFERVAAAGRPWDATLPAELEPAPPPQPFREALGGLAVREVHEPDVFRHFFGTAGPR
jgi:hypothetical protein